MPCFTRLPNLIQDIIKKKNARRYCAIHKLHYYTTCPLCDKKQNRIDSYLRAIENNKVNEYRDHRDKIKSYRKIKKER